MSAFGSADLQNSTGERLASHNDKPGEQIAFPPFSGKLSVDDRAQINLPEFQAVDR
jgi:hypothetical protein